MIDLAFIHNKNSSFWPIEFEFHIVLEKNSSIFYYYSIHKYLDDKKGKYDVGELRWAFRTSDDPFKYYTVDDKRAGHMIETKDMDGAQTVQDSTWKLKDG